MKKKKIRVGHILIYTALTVCILISIGLITFNAMFMRIAVEGRSMNPGINDGDTGYMLRVNKNTKINRFDIVVLDVSNTPEDDNSWIKRVLGLPGETVVLNNNVLYINNEVVEQPFEFNPSNSNYSVTLEDNQYFVCGDNRPVSAKRVVTKDKIEAIGGFIFSFCSKYNSSGVCTDHKLGGWKFL